MSRFVTDSRNGNRRGLYSTDTQFDRLSADQVTSGRYSAIFAGINNKVTASGSAVFAGYDNDVSGNNSYVGGGLNLVKGEYAFLFGFNNEIEGYYSFFVGKDNSNANNFLFGFGQYGNFYNGGNDYASSVAILCSNSYNIGTPDYAEDAQPNGAVTMGGYFPFPIFTGELVKTAYTYSPIYDQYFNAPEPANTIQCQSSQVLMTGEKDIVLPYQPDPTVIPVYSDGVALKLEGGINNIPDGGTNLTHIKPALTDWIVTVDWILKIPNGGPESRAGQDIVTVGPDQFGNFTVKDSSTTISFGQGLSLADVFTTYFVAPDNPNSMEIRINKSINPTDPSYSATYRAAARVTFVQTLGYLS
jgi:hypothetical protein